MENKAFDFDENEKFHGADFIKNELISEIDIIREAMVMVNMFIGEPLKTGMALLNELEPQKNTNE
ncbi:MAG: hypothetical protein NXI00_00100 [Cytophagales bacterium]|nr:hypothetical protein [Cytophagales bacterium]